MANLIPWAKKAKDIASRAYDQVNVLDNGLSATTRQVQGPQRSVIQQARPIAKGLVQAPAQMINTAAQDVPVLDYSVRQNIAAHTNNRLAYQHATQNLNAAMSGYNQNHGGLLNAGTFYNAQDAARGDLKTGAEKIGGGTLQTMATVAPFAKGGSVAATFGKQPLLKLVPKLAAEGAAYGATYSAGAQEQATGHIDPRQLAQDTLAGTVMNAGLPIAGRATRFAAPHVGQAVLHGSEAVAPHLTQAVTDVAGATNRAAQTVLPAIQAGGRNAADTIKPLKQYMRDNRNITAQQKPLRRQITATQAKIDSLPLGDAKAQVAAENYQRRIDSLQGRHDALEASRPKILPNQGGYVNAKNPFYKDDVPQSPLHQEALKYKSAEEFVKNRTVSAAEVERLNPDSAEVAKGDYIRKTVPLSDFDHLGLSRQKLAASYPNNHSEQSLASLAKGGDIAPIITDSKGAIIDGQHRVVNAKENGQTHIEALVKADDKTKKQLAGIHREAHSAQKSPTLIKPTSATAPDLKATKREIAELDRKINAFEEDTPAKRELIDRRNRRQAELGEEAAPKADPTELTRQNFKNLDKYDAKNTEMVPIDEAMKYMEHDRAAKPLMSAESYAKLRDDIAKNGIKEPLTLSYGAKDRIAAIGEGNHRLAIAKELGIKEVPMQVTGTQLKKADQLAESKGFSAVSGREPDATGYVPSNQKPSDIGIKAAGAAPTIPEHLQPLAEEAKKTVNNAQKQPKLTETNPLLDEAKQYQTPEEFARETYNKYGGSVAKPGYNPSRFDDLVAMAKRQSGGDKAKFQKIIDESVNNNLRFRAESLRGGRFDWDTNRMKPISELDSDDLYPAIGKYNLPKNGQVKLYRGYSEKGDYKLREGDFLTPYKSEARRYAGKNGQIDEHTVHVNDLSGETSSIRNGEVVYTPGGKLPTREKITVDYKELHKQAHAQAPKKNLYDKLIDKLPNESGYVKIPGSGEGLTPLERGAQAKSQKTVGSSEGSVAPKAEVGLLPGGTPETPELHAVNVKLREKNDAAIRAFDAGDKELGRKLVAEYNAMVPESQALLAKAKAAAKAGPSRLDGILKHYEEFPKSFDLDSLKAEFKNDPAALKTIEASQAKVKTNAAKTKFIAQKEAEIASKFNSAKTVGDIRAAEAEMRALRKNPNDPAAILPTGKEVKMRTIKTADGKTEHVAQIGDTVKDRVGRSAGFKATATSPNFKSEAEMNKWIKEQGDKSQNLEQIAQADAKSRPQGADQTAFEKAHNSGNIAEEAKVAAKLKDPALRGEQLAPTDREAMLAKFRANAAKAAEAEKPLVPTHRAYGRTIEMTEKNGYHELAAADGGKVYQKVARTGSNAKGTQLTNTYYAADGTKLTQAQADAMVKGQMASGKFNAAKEWKATREKVAAEWKAGEQPKKLMPATVQKQIDNWEIQAKMSDTSDGRKFAEAQIAKLREPYGGPKPPKNPGKPRATTPSPAPAERGSNVRGFVKTAVQSENTAAPVVRGVGTPKATYDSLPNKTSFKKADAAIDKAGFQRSVTKAKTSMDGSTETQALSLRVLDELQGKKDYEQAIDVVEKIAERATRNGQATQILAAYNRLKPEGILLAAQREIRNALKENPTKYKNLKMTPEQAEHLRSTAEKVQAMEPGEAKDLATWKMIDEIHAVVPTTGARKFITLWKAGLLTGIKGAVGGNSVGNSSKILMQKLSDVPASGADAVISQFSHNGRQKLFTVRGLIPGFGEGVKVGYKNFRNGVGAVDVATNNKLDYGVHKVNYSSSPLGRAAQKYTDSVFNFYAANDRPFYYSALRNNLQELAQLEAKRKGLRGADARKFADYTAKNPTEEMNVQAVEAAQGAVFQDKNALGAGLAGFKRGAAKTTTGEVASEITLPFTGVPSSVATALYHYSPVGAVNQTLKAIRQAKTGTFDGAAQRQLSEAIGTGITGTGLMYIGAQLVKNQQLTLGYPTDPQERAVWESEKKQPYSILLGGKWRSLNYTGPGMAALAIGGQVQAAKDAGSKGINAIGSGLAQSGKAIIASSPLQGAQTTLDALTDTERFGPKYVQNLASSIVPTLVKDVASTFDSKQREVNGAKDAIQNKIPLWKNQLMPKKGVFGEDLTRTTGPVGTMIDPFKSSKASGDTVSTEIDRLNKSGFGVSPSKIDAKFSLGTGPDGKPQSFTMTNQQLNEYKGIVGAATKEAWNQALADPAYKSLDDKQKQSLLQDITNSTRDQALSEYSAKNNIGEYAPGFKGDGTGSTSSTDTPDQRIKALQEKKTVAQFKNSPERTKVVGDTFYYKNKTGGVSSKPVYQHDYEVTSTTTSLEMDRAKARKDVGAWYTQAQKKADSLQGYISHLDPETDTAEINSKTLELENLMDEAAKYQSYGNSFTKGRSGSGGSTAAHHGFQLPSGSSSGSVSVNTSRKVQQLLKNAKVSVTRV